MLDMPNVLTYYDVTKDVIKLPWIYFYSSDKLHLVLCGEFFALANITFSLGSWWSKGCSTLSVLQRINILFVFMSVFIAE